MTQRIRRLIRRRSDERRIDMVEACEKMLDLNAMNRAAASQMFRMKCAELARAQRRIRELELELAAYEAAASGYLEVSHRSIVEKNDLWM